MLFYCSSFDSFALTLCTFKHRKRTCTYLSSYLPRLHNELDYVRLSRNLYIHYVRLSRNLYIHYVHLSRNLYIHYVRLSTSINLSYFGITSLCTLENFITFATFINTGCTNLIHHLQRKKSLNFNLGCRILWHFRDYMIRNLGVFCMVVNQIEYQASHSE